MLHRHMPADRSWCRAFAGPGLNLARTRHTIRSRALQSRPSTRHGPVPLFRALFMSANRQTYSAIPVFFRCYQERRHLGLVCCESFVFGSTRNFCFYFLGWGDFGFGGGEMELNSADIAETIALKAVTLTHVRYHKGDLLGHALSWFSLLPVFIALGGFLSHFLFRRELQAMFFAMGLIFNEVVNQIIKELAHEARPLTCEALEMCDSNGWPSSHSQYMCFFSMYCTLLATRRLHFADEFRRTFVALLPWPFALTVMYSRVYLGYHTTPQIIAGGSLGLLLGAGWFFLMSNWVSPWFPWLEDTSVCQYLRIKDSNHIPDVIGFEYENSRAARRNDHATEHDHSRSSEKED